MSEPNTGNGLVQVAYLHSDDVTHSWHHSMRRLIDHDREGPRRLASRGEPLNVRCSTGQLVPSRNYAVQLFLDRTPHEWMLMLDTDMGFSADAVDRLLAAADPVDAPVVGALCFAQCFERYDGMGGMRTKIVPTMYRIGRARQTGHTSFSYWGEFPLDQLVRVAATGMGFVLMHRSALEKVRAEHGDRWFDQMLADSGNVVGEDFCLCLRFGNAGIPVHVHTGVQTTHLKRLWLGLDDYLDQQLAAQVYPAQPAVDLPVAVDMLASLASLAQNDHVQGGMLKLPADLERYAKVVEWTHPEVVVETGTHTGASARWFAGQPGVAQVVTVDVNNEPGMPLTVRDPYGAAVTYVGGDSVAVADAVRDIVGGRRCMVVLDSDHSAAHVKAEIEAYGPMVTPGCYLVVEDTLLGYASEDLRAQHGMAEMVGSPLDAVAQLLDGAEGWSRDLVVERLSPTSHHPAGWWLRHG